ncbi:hypothetical protein RND71_014606 [Anisodus tanguticus]|uniref:Uncharacterized protein n=1 Tax=Anisodus tanguticus TaxID=243964 RepID=A0AAE1SD35_9SOLA|nr:hypothetical protein RND71_014606 [Anisodus tanguticus]
MCAAQDDFFLPEKRSIVEDDPHKSQHGSGSEEDRVPCLSIAPLNDGPNLEKEKGNDTIDIEDSQFTTELDIKDTFGAKMHDLQTENNMIVNDEMEITNKSDSATDYTCRTDSEVTLSANSSLVDVFTLSKDVPNFHDQNGADGVVLIEKRVNNNPTEKEQFREMQYDSTTLRSSNSEHNNPMEVENEYLVVEKVPSKDVTEREPRAPMLLVVSFGMPICYYFRCQSRFEKCFYDSGALSKEHKSSSSSFSLEALHIYAARSPEYHL